jgi:hypothetical protein
VALLALKTLDFDCLKVPEALESLAMQMFERFDLLTTFKIARQTFKSFISAVRKGYCSNPYHNFRHGFDVLQVVFALCCGVGVRQLRPLEVLACFITALCVHIDHGGVSDQFLVKTRSPLAQLYNDRSVNENHHCTFVWKLLSHPDCNILSGLSQDQWREVRKMVVSCFLGTDMSRHFDVLIKLKLRVEAEQFSFENAEDRAMLMNMLVHAADLSNLCRPYELASSWARNKLEELWRQGDTERTLGIALSPMCDRRTATEMEQVVAAMQVDYCDYVVGPMFDQLQAVLGGGGDEVVAAARRNMVANREAWCKNHGDHSAPTSALRRSPTMARERLKTISSDFENWAPKEAEPPTSGTDSAQRREVAVHAGDKVSPAKSASAEAVEEPLTAGVERQLAGGEMACSCCWRKKVPVVEQAKQATL